MKRRNLNEGASLQYRNELGLNSNTTVGSNISGIVGADEYFQSQIAEVIDVIYSKDHAEFKSNEDIGKIRIRFVDNLDKEETSLTWAWPMNSYVMQYPIIGEIVSIINYLGRFFYFGSLNVFNNVNNNLITGASSSSEKIKSDDKSQYGNVENTNIPNRDNSDSQNKNKTFKENNTQIKPLLPNEGDVIIRGRFGNNIRLGNNSETNSANIKISTGQPDDVSKSNLQEPFIENINESKNSIWLTSDESIELKSSTQGKSYYLKSAKNAPNKLEGNQIIINSDRIIWNAKQEEILMFSNKGIAFNTNGYVAIDCAQDISMYTLEKFNLTAEKGTYIDSKEIILGKNAKERMVLGDTLLDILSELLDELATEKHPTGSGPSGPPLNAPKYKAIKAKLRKILSKQNKTL